MTLEVTKESFFTEDDLHDALQFALPQVEAEIKPNFTGGHIFVMHRKHDGSPTGHCWAVFVFFLEQGTMTHTTVDIFNNEKDANSFADDISNNVFGGIAKDSARTLH